MEVEYIPGDVVMTNGVPLGTAEGVVYRVTACDPSKTLKLNDDGTVLKGTVYLENIESANLGDKGFLMGDCCAWVKDIVPLKFSKEILEKNEWKYSKNIGYISIYYDKGCVDDGVFTKRVGYVDLLLIRDSNKLNWGEEDCFINVLHEGRQIATLQYVHQLQHLLFGLGVDNRLKV